MIEIMIIILLIYSVSAYFFSGVVCYLAFRSSVNPSLTVGEWQRYIRAVTNLGIVFFLPIWIVGEIQKNPAIKSATSSPKKHDMISNHSLNF